MVYFYLDINSSYIIENSLQLLHPGAMFRYVAFRSCKDVKRSASGSLVTIVRASGPCHVQTFLDGADGHTHTITRAGNETKFPQCPEKAFSLLKAPKW